MILEIGGITDPQLQRNLQTLDRLLIDTGGLSVQVRFGSVTAAGAVQRGTGFTVTKNAGSGDYTVNTTFARAPIVIVCAGESAGALTAKLKNGVAPSTSGFTVNTFTTNTGTLTDSIFDWVAIG